MYDGLGIAPYTFLICLCVQLCFIEIYGSSDSVGFFVEKVDRNRYVLFTGTFKRITNTGSMMRFPVHKGYYGKPTHHTGVSYLKWLLISKLLNPRPADLPAKTLWA